MTTRTRKATSTTPAPAGTPAKRAAAKKTPAARTPRKKAPAKKTTKPRLSLVKATPSPTENKTRLRDFVTDAQIYAVHAARLAGLPTHRIRDWHDHRDGTATRPLADGSRLHYTHPTRTLRWQALCPMGATHEYVIDSPSTAIAARVDADRCNQPHATFDHIPGMSRDEFAAQGIHTGSTWARPDLIGDDITQTVPVPLPTKQRALADQLTHSDTGTTDTQPLSAQEIADSLTARADHEQMKEHPQP